MSSDVQITWHQAPADPAQQATWQRLWAQLLDAPEPETSEAPGAATSEASKNCGPDCVNQAAATRLHTPDDAETSDAM
jgi:hypothetical protein